ncbi:DUF6457 domain-containing protein [Actinomycetes bacterium KLBMP 9759]
MEATPGAQNADQGRVDEWLVAAGRELGLENATMSPQGLDSADILADLVSRHVDPDAAAPTVFLLGMAAGRALDPAVAAHDHVEKLTALARSWKTEE